MPSPIEMLMQLMQGGGQQAQADPRTQILQQMMTQAQAPAPVLPQRDPRKNRFGEIVPPWSDENTVSDEPIQNEYKWEGTDTPTQRDINYARAYGGDAVMESFVKQFGYPPLDKVNNATEEEMNQAMAMRSDNEIKDEQNTDYEWEGDRVPTERDLAWLDKHGGDAAYAAFFQQFPDYVRETMMQRGGSGGPSPDQYAMDDEEWEALNANRKTRIDER